MMYLIKTHVRQHISSLGMLDISKDKGYTQPCAEYIFLYYI